MDGCSSVIEGRERDDVLCISAERLTKPIYNAHLLRNFTSARKY